MTAEARRTPLSVPKLFGETFRIYGRFPLLLLVLAAGVLVPYLLIVLAATGTGPFTRSHLSFGISQLLFLIDLALVDPLISALHVHAVADLEEGHTPRLGDIARRGLRVLPHVSAAAIMAGIAFAGGLLLLVIPGIYIYLRLIVVAQTAAIERHSWMDVLRRSWALTEGNVIRVLGFFVCIGVIEVPSSLLLGKAFADAATAISFSVGLAVQILVRSFTALAIALLYFDLRSRHELVEARRSEVESTQPLDPSATNHSLDPRRFNDEGRPKGWYVDPSQPEVMRYWDGGDPPSWRGKTRTPRKVREQWQESATSRSPADD